MLSSLKQAMLERPGACMIDIIFTDDENLNDVKLLTFDDRGIAIESRNADVRMSLIPWTAIAVVNVKNR